MNNFDLWLCLISLLFTRFAELQKNQKRFYASFLTWRRERKTMSKYMLRNQALLRDSLEVISDWHSFTSKYCFNVPKEFANMFRRSLFQAFGYECKNMQTKWALILLYYWWIAKDLIKLCWFMQYGIDRKTWFGVTHELLSGRFLANCSSIFPGNDCTFSQYLIIQQSNE